MTEDPSLNYQQAAQSVNRSTRTIMRLVEEDFLTPYTKPGSRRHLFRPSDVPRALKKREQTFRKAKRRKKPT